MRGFSKGLLVSVLVHGLVAVVVYAVPVDKLSKPEVISVDFTLVDQGRVSETVQVPGPVPGRLAVAKGKAHGMRQGMTQRPALKQGDSIRTDMDPRPMEREPDRMPPGADPAQSEPPFATSSGDAQGTQGMLSSSDGVPVSGTSGGFSPGDGPAQGYSGGTSVASLSRPGRGVTGDTFGGGQAGILREIRDSVMKNVNYPDKARRMGWEGRVIVSFTVHEDGSIHDARIMHSSGTPVLDDAAKEALRNATVRAQFAKKVQVVLPIEYRLK